jgi:VIT1/CCC1 family predicted Fe2+/Mn2+ transporter
MVDVKTPHSEKHRSHRSQWLRAAVLGVDDGIVSTASLMIGVTAAAASKSTILTAGIAGLSAGALSMAVGEYVSVSSQRDSEREDIAIEERSIANYPDEERDELAKIYEQRGLAPDLAHQVANEIHQQGTAAAVIAHARDELGIDHEALANPAQAAVASAVSFALGALVPVLAAALASRAGSGWFIVLASLVALAISGAVGAVIGGGKRWVAALRVLCGGGLAMAITALIGHVVGTHL